MAAQAGVRYSITNPDVYIESNLIGFYNILEACRHSYDDGQTGVEHLVYASSSSVYGSNKKVPYSTEDKVDNPVSLYAATKKSNITRISYVDTSGKITYAIDKHYAILVQTKDEEGRVLEEHYLNENEEPTECWGYFGISYEHREGEDIITYLDEEGNPVKTQTGYAIIVRSLDELGQALDDRYYDENWNPVMCTGGYYGMHREHDEKGRTTEIVYLDIDGAPACIMSGFAKEKRVFDEEDRMVRKFYFDADDNPVCLSLGQAGEAYSYDEYDRINQVTYLDSDGNPIITTAGYTIMKREYYRDGTEKSNRYFDASGNPVSLKKGKYGIQYVGDISLYLNRNGKIKWCVDNLLTGYPFMVVAAGVLLCILL